VEPLEEEETTAESLVLVPEEFKVEPSHKVVTIHSFASNCTLNWHKNMKIIVPSNLLEKLTFNGKDYFLVLENHVMLGIDGQ
tara:strand:- start:281 stop:526 length:246 start_codon:yes stop_codon:yes gene_type:complete